MDEGFRLLPMPVMPVHDPKYCGYRRGYWHWHCPRNAPLQRKAGEQPRGLPALSTVRASWSWITIRCGFFISMVGSQN